MNSKLTVGDIVVHVTLPGMQLTPRVLVRSDVLTFHKIDRSRVKRRVQITRLNTNPVRHTVVVDGRCDRSGPGEGYRVENFR